SIRPCTGDPALNDPTILSAVNTTGTISLDPCASHRRPSRSASFSSTCSPLSPYFCNRASIPFSSTLSRSSSARITIPRSTNSSTVTTQSSPRGLPPGGLYVRPPSYQPTPPAPT